MERFLKFILLPLILTASLPGLGFCYSIINSPENATVLAGSDARFNCTVSVGWLILIWLFNGNPVLTVINPQGAIETSDRFTSRNYTSSNGFTSELIIHNTQLSDSGKIECSTQQPNESSFAFLSVQVNGSLFIKNSTLTVTENKTVEIVCEALEWAPAPDIAWMTNDSFIDKSRYVTQQSQGSNGLHNALSILTLTPVDTEILTCLADIEALPNPQNATVTVIFVNSTMENDYIEDSRSTWVIVLAVVLSVVGIVLLIIIIAVVVRCCCLKKKGSTYENEIRKVSAEKKKDGNLGNRQRHGSENQGYIPEELWNTEEDPRIYSLLPRYPKFTVRAEDLHTSSASKVQPQRPTDYPINPKKIRNMTLV
ncbi:immunoglobulin superfamily member 5 isoform X1 [Columba livia]|uniref:immunoglobulin superfamily member 5 isoform X1 n=1 Tax=Columba livia TaxID=8932 RepID=UPI00039911DB|nr:immunoglobulin superfamily member 5 isoform X1 [Columba livia]XP_021155306.1 immunoglobulin superfamily member 5 isoform X1 [Columba livia]XP_021155307.1 immunoglobulin superfamily member 5 isoform X1 [Columba livia]XP_021155308.1 immunoglobulin superfamily member 5 isoform X1 [Columba livia]XP_021155309.1 immunoglobulin superfamily member 5 isoform X1 [Columba livia]PKK32878.1 immunoglobulin superfamily, member 5, transcript variant X1 [Columba livia]